MATQQARPAVSDMISRFREAVQTQRKELRLASEKKVWETNISKLEKPAEGITTAEFSVWFNQLLVTNVKTLAEKAEALAPIIVSRPDLVHVESLYEFLRQTKSEEVFMFIMDEFFDAEASDAEISQGKDPEKFWMIQRALRASEAVDPETTREFASLTLEKFPGLDDGFAGFLRMIVKKGASAIEHNPLQLEYVVHNQKEKGGNGQNGKGNRIPVGNGEGWKGQLAVATKGKLPDKVANQVTAEIAAEFAQASAEGESAVITEQPSEPKVDEQVLEPVLQ